MGMIEWLIGIALSNKISNLNPNTVMPIYEWLIVITSILSVWSWKKATGKIFTPYVIFFAFLLVFNAGQFVMWAFGIHYVTRLSSELGVSRHIRYMDKQTLLHIMMITAAALNFFHSGALLIGSMHLEKAGGASINLNQNEKIRIGLRYVGIVLLVVSYVISIYVSIYEMNIARVSGYTSLYYGDSQITNPLIKYISYMFLPSFFAVFIGYKYSKKVFRVLSVVFLPYMLLNIIIGDRGSWIYFLCIWIWCYWTFFSNDGKDYKQKLKNNKKRFIFLVIIGALSLTVVTIFVKFRDIGFQNISSRDIQEVVKDARYIFVKPFFEMGQSARVLGIVLQDNLHGKWSGGNTYLAGIVSMVLPRIKLWLGLNDGYLDNWLSQTYLGLKNYGEGFSAIAEAYLNGGEFFYPFYMFIVGGVIGKNTYFEINNESKQDYGKLFIALSSVVSLITICRGSVELSLRKWFYGCFVIWLLARLMAKYFIKERERSKK